jgi:hypothetical protein
MARRFGSAMTSKADSMLIIYAIKYIRVKVYKYQCLGWDLGHQGVVGGL